MRRNPQHGSLFDYFQPLPRLRFNLKSTAKRLPPVVNHFMRQTLSTINGTHFFMNILCTESFCLQKIAQQKAVLQQCTPQTWSPFLLRKPAFEHVHGRLLRRLSWSWTVLLPSGTYTKPITSITAILLPFVTYLLTPFVVTSYKRSTIQAPCLVTKKQQYPSVGI
jgi:hypothetical protein